MPVTVSHFVDELDLWTIRRSNYVELYDCVELSGLFAGLLVREIVVQEDAS